MTVQKKIYKKDEKQNIQQKQMNIEYPLDKCKDLALFDKENNSTAFLF
jgi:hypothetical protein